MTTTLWITDIFYRGWVAVVMDALGAVQGVKAVCVEPDTGQTLVDHTESVCARDLLEAVSRRGLHGRLDGEVH